ncbi:MAG: TrbI/VirB10 family protein [Candidatus Thiodiazotropha sp. (ex. Lucinoma kazani)]
MYSLIIALGVVMMLGFLFQSLNGKQQKQIASTPDKELAPDPGALLSEIKRQNDAALRAKEELLRKERELARAKLELQEKEITGSYKAQQNGQSDSDEADKIKEREEAGAISKVVAIRGDGQGFGIPLGKVDSGRQQEQNNQIINPAAPMPISRIATNRFVMPWVRAAEQDDRPMNQRWMDQQAASAQKKDPIRPSTAREDRVIHEGTIVSAVLVTRIDSDLPGMITARVLHNIYDTQSGMKLAIPAGSRLIGRYNSATEVGQSRVMAAFHRVILPDGRSLYLKGVGGIGDQGAAGIPGDVDNHFWELLGTNLLVATATWFMETSDDSSSTTVNVGGGSGSSGSTYGDIMVDMAKQLTKPYADRKPTIRVEPGETFNIIINQDIVLSGRRQ